MPPVHLNPATELADRVLLPGDPQRALTIAQAVLEEPRMFNTRRGLWGYTGTAPDGRPASVQSTGMGGPSAAIVVEELVELGGRAFLRVGTCGALDPTLSLGELVVVSSVLPFDGASSALGSGARLEADRGLTEAIKEAGVERAVAAVSTDLFYDPRGLEPEWRDAGASVVEMEAATVLAVAARHGLRAACVLLVTDLLADGERRRISAAELEAGERRLGRVAIDALGAA
jgi:uridine phosphorylase